MEETKDLLRKLEPQLGEKTRGLWYLNLLSSNSEQAQRNRQLLRLLADKNAKIDYTRQIRLPPPPSQQLGGEFHLGSVIYPDSEYSGFGLRKEELPKHLLLAGMTGVGKTNLCFQLLRQLAKADIPFLIFDWKRNYRRLKEFPEFANLKIYRLGSDSKFRFNPLIPPPGTSPTHWMPLLVDVMGHAFFVAQGVEYFLRKGITEAYNRFRVFEGESQYPTFSDVERVLSKEFVRGREMLWMASVKRTLAVLASSGVLADILQTPTNDHLPDILNGQIVIELDDLATIERVFLVEALLLWIYQYRKAQSKTCKLQHVTLIEEAHHILSARKEFTNGQETIMESIIRMIREFGEGIVVVDQEPSKLSRSVLANTNTKVCFNLGSGWDIRAMSAAMNLKPEERDCIDLLPVGQAIIKIKNRIDQPVLVRFPLTKD